MKRILLLFAVIISFTLTGNGQPTKYVSYSSEMIFSFASIDQGGEESSLMRWAPVFNMQGMYNVDMNRHFGVFTGLAFRNVGYIYDNYAIPNTELPRQKKKFRTYNLAIPVGFKVGNLDKMFLFAGYELEFPFHYKEKTYDGGDKIDKITGWFSKRYEPIQHGFLAGVQFPGGATLKFKYYLSEFHNQDYTDGSGNKPYEGLQSNIFYFSLNYNLFSKVDYNKM